ncbi:MAG: response regulator [Paracoccaceae bacterium]
MTILLAEDNVTNQLVATSMLESLGAVVDVAADGAIALERLKTQVYDVLLIDIEMPRVSGLDVIRAVRADEGPLCAAPVIALTAYAMEEHREKILKAGADGLIPKPITSIRQFGIDVLTHMDTRAARNREGADKGAAVIERTVFECLASSMGVEVMKELLQRMAIDFAIARDDIDAASDAGDPERMRGASHILIGLAGLIGAVRLQRQAERLQAFAENEDMDEMTALAAETAPELDRVIRFVAAEQAGRIS